MEHLSNSQDSDPNKESIKSTALGFFGSIKRFLIELLDFRNDTDREATISAIKSDIPFKGATAWILICSAFVASVGLNANSTAVVIGAMLISPLMGPILGVGMSIAINDIDTLKKSLISLSSMIVLTLFAAFMFFYLFPYNEAKSELLGRIRPDIRDVLIAFFGGLALIIARTKKGTIASVIFGVAIATALIPPLCTAGYGLAMGEWKYFFGALFLFAINTIFIAIATFIVLKVLGFPMIRYANSKRRKFVARLVAILALSCTIPALWIFFNVLEESRFQQDYKTFINNEIMANDQLWLQRHKMEMSEKKITLNFNGEINEVTRTDLFNELRGYQYIKDFSLIVNGNKNRSSDKILELYDQAVSKLEERNLTIDRLQADMDSLESFSREHSLEKDYLAFIDMSKDAKIEFGALKSIALGQLPFTNNFKTADTLFIARVQWDKKLNDSLVGVSNDSLKDWLKYNFDKANLEVYNP